MSAVSVLVLALLPGLAQAVPESKPGLPVVPTQAELAELAERYGERWTPEARAYRMAGPAVVTVQGYRKRLSPLSGAAGARAGQLISQGSGVIIDAEGFVITNAHVIAPEDDKSDDQLACRVTFSPEFGGRAFDAQVISLDREWDLALLKLRGEGPFPALFLCKEDDVLIGERVIALGAPLGSSLSLTTGVLSGIGRDILVQGVRDVHRLSGVLQTDAAINPGNSGGPLLNMRGDLIGINSATMIGAEGISYAIPSARVRQILESRLYRPHVWLGMGMRPDTLLVERVHPRGPAAQAGLREGDRILSVDGVPVAESAALQRELLMRRAEEVLSLDYERIAAPTATPVRASTRLKLDAEEAQWTLGMLGFSPVVEQLKIPVPDKRYDQLLNILRVVEVFPGSGAEALGLLAGDTIVAVRLINGVNGDGWVLVSSRKELLDMIRGGQLDFDGLNLWWIKSNGTSLKGRLTFDDPDLRVEAS
ncbi:MAG: trypsin-like peptidase domain-containing protein [Planctomycetota bacterium]|nr:trypsin-like peptidase domain-containing protein [Planctomycetota bacterium]